MEQVGFEVEALEEDDQVAGIGNHEPINTPFGDEMDYGYSKNLGTRKFGHAKNGHAKNWARGNLGTQKFGLGTRKMGTQKFKARINLVWAREKWARGNLGTRKFGHAEIWARRHVGTQGTRARRHVGTLGTRFSILHIPTQGQHSFIPLIFKKCLHVGIRDHTHTHTHTHTHKNTHSGKSKTSSGRQNVQSPNR